MALKSVTCLQLIHWDTKVASSNRGGQQKEQKKKEKKSVSEENIGLLFLMLHSAMWRKQHLQNERSHCPFTAN